MLRFHVSNKRERQQFEHPLGPIEFGRGPKRNETARCVVQDLSVSRDHIRMEEASVGQLRIENLSTKNPIRLADNSIIAPGATRILALPARLTVGETLIEIEPVSADDAVPRESLLTVAQPPRSLRRPGRTEQPSSLLDLGATPAPDLLTHWFETVISVQRAAAGSPAFYDQTARALVDLVGLDRGLVLLRGGDKWEVVARCLTEYASGREFSETVLAHVAQEKRTLFQPAGQALTTAESLQGVEAVVASPIFDSRDNVVGMLYGTRNRHAAARGVTIGPLEAQVVQLLACAVGAGLARLEQEAEATRRRVQFEQFFSADLARELESSPDLLQGREHEITVMFSDLRGSSRIAENLGPHDSCRLIGDVMERLTARIREHDGVLVDYLGDGLLAMWNAPTKQPNHAAQACRAALGMLDELPKLNADWKEHAGVSIGIGIGINTGKALVGNTGSSYKFKYGPLGHAVNLASRVEGATKQLKVPILITGSTRSQLGDGFAMRRLCTVRVVGIQEPVDLYELCGAACAPEWTERRDRYEQALALYEAGKWSEAHLELFPLLAVSGERVDIPSVDLAQRALACVKDPPAMFDPVMELSSK
jgi:adenylate cyclase